MKSALSKWVQSVWYGNTSVGLLLAPLALLFGVIVAFRRWCYRTGVKTQSSPDALVIVVGNITLGGTGKTPLVIWLARFLREAGFRPGIISRGYGGESKQWPVVVNASSSPRLVGDEALLLARHAGAPVVIGPDRIRSANQLVADFSCDVILSDDGLQHYKLRRDIEIAVIDGMRKLGNCRLFPAGPLREPPGRFKEVDFVIVNGEKADAGDYAMQLVGDEAVNLKTGETRALRDFAGTTCHAVAGIGHPGRFFKALSAEGLMCREHEFPDHYRFTAHDLDFGDNQPILMTEKDAVKCQDFAKASYWVLPVSAQIEPAFGNALLNLMKNRHDRKKTA